MTKIGYQSCSVWPRTATFKFVFCVSLFFSPLDCWFGYVCFHLFHSPPLHFTSLRHNDFTRPLCRPPPVLYNSNGPCATRRRRGRAIHLCVSRHDERYAAEFDDSFLFQPRQLFVISPLPLLHRIMLCLSHLLPSASTRVLWSSVSYLAFIYLLPFH